MKVFKCQFIDHEDESIMGFCINKDCQKSTQFCFKCLTKVHQDHPNDCLRFNNLSAVIKEHITTHTNLITQYHQIKSQLVQVFEKNEKKLEQYIQILKQIDSELQNQSYQFVKQQIPLLKQLQSKDSYEKQNSFIEELNKTIKTFETFTIDDIKIQEISDNSSHIKQQDSIETQKKQKAQELQLKDEQKRQKIVGKQLLDYEQDDEACKFQPNSSKDGISAGNYLLKGNSLLNQNNYEEAIQCFDNALKINPNNCLAFNNKGNALYQLNRFEEAIKCHDQALTINPNNCLAFNNKGDALYKLNRFEEAIKCHDSALNINPQDCDVLNKKGNSLQNLYRFQEAIKCYDKALTINPNNFLSFNNKGNTLYRLNRFEEAIKCYDNALKINPQDEEAQTKRLSALGMLKKQQ
ncbi:unnamed protein product [Paramecium pentaurelia]|uniref:Tetratricopeptide repeat protein n=1 Tax=Paramecium pentaurelia TaxID=43138 RepID=A0A8S1VMD9_9CILI|nr:unnamed protein product [Paramecium pentaurelia]